MHRRRQHRRCEMSSFLQQSLQINKSKNHKIPWAKRKKPCNTIYSWNLLKNSWKTQSCCSSCFRSSWLYCSFPVVFLWLASTKHHWGNDLLDSVAFRWLLIDEATQATEPATLIPIARTESDGDLIRRSDGIDLMALIRFSRVDQRKCRRKRREKLPSFGRMHHHEVVSDRPPNIAIWKFEARKCQTQNA